MSDTDTQTTVVDPPAQADTADTQASEASTQSNETPEATQGTEAQEAPQTEVKAEDTVEDKLYAGKYKSVEDMEKAYTELQSKFGQTTSEKAELSRILNDSFTTPAPADTGDGFTDEPDPVNQEIDNLKRVTAVQSFILSHPDADPTSMQKVLAEDPLVKQISGHEAKLEYALLRSQSMSQPKAIEEAEKRAAQATQAKIAEKQTAQVESAAKSAPVDEKAELNSRMSSGTQEQRDAARREYIKKYLV